MVEPHVANVVVAGSSPVSRSMIYDQSVGVGILFAAYSVRYFFVFGGIAKWLRQRSAKPLFIGSNPIAASSRS